MVEAGIRSIRDGMLMPPWVPNGHNGAHEEMHEALLLALFRFSGKCVDS